MILQTITNRRSVRGYKPDPVPEKIILEIIKAGQFAPTSRDNRAVEFIIVKDPETKEKLYQAAVPEQEFVREAPVLIIPATDPAKTNQPVQDLSLATQNILLQAAALSLGTVWKNLKAPQAEAVKKILDLPEKYLVINLIPLGYPKETPAPHTDADFDEKRIHVNHW